MWRGVPVVANPEEPAVFAVIDEENVVFLPDVICWLHIILIMGVYQNTDIAPIHQL